MREARRQKHQTYQNEPKMDSQQGPTVYIAHVTLPVLCGSLDRRGFGGEHTYVRLSPFTVHLKLSQHS